MTASLRFLTLAVVLFTTGSLLFIAVGLPVPDRSSAPIPTPSAASPQPTALAVPTESPSLATTGTANDGVFELTVTTPRETWIADEPVSVSATFGYVGVEPPSGFRGDSVIFEVEQLDGPIDSGWARDLNCPGDVYARGEVRTFPYRKSGTFDPQGDLADFWRAWNRDPELRLPAGTYQIITHALYALPDCGGATDLDASVTVEVLEAADATDEPDERAGTPLDAPTEAMAALWSPVGPERIPVRYSCGGPLTFTTTDLAEAAKPEDASPPIDANALLVDVRAVPADSSGWLVAANDGDQALLVHPIDTDAHDGATLYYLAVTRGADGWKWTGDGVCQPVARFAGRGALGGYWRLDGSRARPAPGSSVLHLRVWSSRACMASVELRGKPVVRMTPDAVLVAVPVSRAENTDMCAPGRPARIDVELPEALGDRAIYDMGTLPVRRIARG